MFLSGGRIRDDNGSVTDCALCGRPAPELNCGWAPCPRYCRACTRGMRRLNIRPEGFDVDVLRCQACGRTTVAHGGVRAPCEVCRPTHWVLFGSQLVPGDSIQAERIWDRVDGEMRGSGFALIGERVHVKAKKAPPSRRWVQHLQCGRVMPEVGRCPWCDGIPDRSLATIGHLPAYLYLVRLAGRQRLLKIGIGLASGNRLQSHLRHGATVIEVRRAPLWDCRTAEANVLRTLSAWSSRPSIPWPSGGDTECFRPSAPSGHSRTGSSRVCEPRT